MSPKRNLPLPTIPYFPYSRTAIPHTNHSSPHGSLAIAGRVEGMGNACGRSRQWAGWHVW